MAGQPEKITNYVLELLKQDTNKLWGQEELVNAIKARGETNLPCIAWVIRSLVQSGRINGRIKGTKAFSIQHKEFGSSSSSGSQQAQQTAQAVQQGGQDKIIIQGMAKEINSLKAALQAAKAEAANTAQAVFEVQVKNEAGETVKSTKGLFHKQFRKIMSLVKARKNIFIYGPTGCGKSHVCAQIAETLEMEFGFVSCTSGMSEGVLGGRLLPTGEHGKFEYVVSEFVWMYENGGIFLLDEIDAADPNVLLFINAALANNRVAISNRPDKPYAVRHPDFVCVAAANTVGTGTDRMYTGRNKLDGSTLDRFAIGKVYMGYDERVEALLCPNDDLRNRLTKYRGAINAHRLERAMSTRFMRDAFEMVEAGWTFEEVDEAFFQGWREDEINKVKQHARV